MTDQSTGPHLAEKRLFEIVKQKERFAEKELDHVEKCNMCLDAYAKIILQDARGLKQKG